MKAETCRQVLFLHFTKADIFGTVARNIHFGVNSDGMAVLQYYDNSGVLLYDLGPDGIKAKDLQSSQWVTDLQPQVLHHRLTV
jgi:hypothetical protein